jgi:hypothetical protein
MSFWQILRPQAGQNLITNPSFENNTTTGWTDVDATSVPSTSWQYRGAYSLAITPLANVFAGVYYLSDTLVADTYTYSISGKFASGVPYRIRIATTTGTTVASTAFVGTGDTQIVSVTAALSAVQYRLFIQKNNDASTAVFYVDAAQLEPGSVATTYIDGDQDGCAWDNIWRESTSTRSGQSTAGGVWLDFETDLGIIPLEMQGVGMPPIDNVATPYALLPGARFERALARSRVFTILCLVPGSTWQNMHALREALIGRVQPDQTAQQQPIYLRYTGSAEPQIIAAFYDGGLEFSQPDGFAEQVPLRFVAHDPFWYSERDRGAVLTADNVFYSYLGTYDNNGNWASLDSNVSATLNGDVYAIIEDADGTLIVGGAFTNIDGAGTDYLARYDPADGTWSPMATPSPNNIVRALYRSPRSGNIYVGGDFTSIGGVTANRIAEFFGVWGSIGSPQGTNNTVNGITSIDYLGTERIIVTGTFTTAGGVTVNRIAAYDTFLTNWIALSTGLNSTGNVVVPDGRPGFASAFYVGGAFTTAGGATVNRIARYSGTAWQAMGTTGVNGTVNALSLSSDGILYVGGAFTTAGGVSAPYLVSWNGVGWVAINHRFTAAVTALTTRNTTLYVAGAQSSPVLGFNELWQYNNGVWFPIDNAEVQATSTTRVLLWTKRGVFYHGGPGSVSFGVPAVIDSEGTAPTAPVLYQSTGFVNFTNRQALYWQPPVFTSLIVDLRSGQQRVYDPVTDTSYASALVAGSNINTVLQPGSNRVASFFSDQVIYWRPRNWSLDV